MELQEFKKKKKKFGGVILLLDFDLQMDLITKLLCDNGFDCFVALIPLRDDPLQFQDVMVSVINAQLFGFGGWCTGMHGRGSQASAPASDAAGHGDAGGTPQTARPCRVVSRHATWRFPNWADTAEISADAAQIGPTRSVSAISA